jgi:hypothetical protein
MKFEVVDVSTWFLREGGWHGPVGNYRRVINFVVHPAFLEKIEFSDGNIFQHPRRAKMDGDWNESVICNISLESENFTPEGGEAAFMIELGKLTCRR